MDQTVMNTRKLPMMIALLIIALSASCGSRQRYNDENDFIVVLHDKEAEIAGYVGSNKDVRIPPRIGSLPVTAIGEGAFEYRCLTSVALPNSIVHIGKDAFSRNKLTGITIPKRTAFIGDRAFMSNDLTHVTLPGSVAEIGYAAFAFNKLGEIIIPDRITSIEGWAFRENRLASITIPEGVLSIGYGAFEDNELTEVIIPKSVTSIGSTAFRDNSITMITIGENVEVKYDTFPKFSYFYNYCVMKRGGTYVFSNYHWSPEDKTIPVFNFTSHTSGKFPDISFFADMPDLEEVELRDNDLLTDITPLSGLTKLKALDINNCPNIESLEPLSRLTNLTRLSITHNSTYDYGTLSSLRRLETLVLSKDLVEIDLRHIGQLHSLKALSINNWGNSGGGTIHINELQSLVNLETLDIFGVDNLDLSWISGLHNLTKLELDGCTITDISPLAALPNLIEVDLTFSKIKDIVPLLHSNSIKYIRVFAHDVDAGIADNVRSMFSRRNIYLDTSYDDR